MPSSAPRKMNTANNLKLALTVSILGAFTTIGQAATVTFGTPTAIVGASDISLDGTLLSATALDFDGNTASDTTVNGVLFVAGTYGGVSAPGHTINGSNVTLFESGGLPALPGPTTGDTGYNELMLHLSFLNSADGARPITLTGLTEGHTYQFQIWSGQGTAGGAWDNSETTFSDGLTSVVVDSRQYVLGTFVADATTEQDLTWSGVDSPSNAGLINGIQIRTIAVPEPSSTALLGLGGLALILRRCK